MAGPANILVIRFSAMGDVAMIQPVLKEFSANYPDIHLVVVSRSQFRSFFETHSKTSFHGIDPKGRHKGISGLYRLFKELKTYQITAIADLHNNLRSRILTAFFSLAGIKTVRLDKGRPEKRQLTRKAGKLLIPLPLTVQRYADVFKKLGYSFTLKNTLQQPQPEYPDESSLTSELQQLLREKEARSTTDIQTSKSKWIGISPFAQHLQKVYPLYKLEEVLTALADKGHQLFIFGGSEEEEKIASEWAEKYHNATSLVRKMSLASELKFISNLDIMLSMDSSGMHLASLKNIPVVSIWGATHPYTGFLGYGQSINNAVQTDLYCRPCSVYGNIPCYRGDFACMNNLSPQTVIDKILNILDNE